MTTYHLHREIRVPQPIGPVFDFFSRAANLGRITPSWLDFQMLTPPGVEMRAGTLLEYKLRVHGLPIRWRTRIEQWNPPHSFVDVQEKGPYKLWRHTHCFYSEGDRTRVTDHVEYALPFGSLGRLVNRLQVARDVAAIFDYRTRQIATLLPAAKGGA
jgi:ligand-binding SRPBCC domain-containing protein